MKIAILGSAPSSLNLAPMGDPSWKIWACSPGTYANVARCDAFFELHRWEPGEVGKPHTQKQWFSPEYVAWMGLRPAVVWMYEPVPQIPRSQALPIDDLKQKYGTYFFTSSIAIMICCAIEDILAARTKDPTLQGEIGLFGVDMAANEEYGYQRAGCQHFLLLAADLGIKILVPPESDLLRPMPVYGISESSHWMIKNTVRRNELQMRLASAKGQLKALEHSVAFLEGALDDLNYQMLTWGEDREGQGTSYEITSQSPLIRNHVIEEYVRANPVPTPAFKQLEVAKKKRKR